MTSSNLPTNSKNSLYDLSLHELETQLVHLGQPAYRARQIWDWLYRKYVCNIDQMLNLPRDLREQLAGLYTLDVLHLEFNQESRDGQTEKVLFKLHDSQLIETVLMKYDRRRTLCISTQAGCAMGCVFCATGQMGFFRHLQVGEIIAQVLFFARQLSREEEHVTNIVLMGMGEPLHNYDHTLAAISTLTDKKGFDLGARKITISTVGLVPAIRQFADEQRQYGLAVSLHAATDEERARLIPVANRWPIDELMAACDYYIEKTGRRLTFEWALIQYENDTREQAQALGRLLRGKLCHVNLIPLNPTKGYSGGPSARERVAAFQNELVNYGVSSSVRVRRGIDIQAGCGQLRDRHIAQQ